MYPFHLHCHSAIRRACHLSAPVMMLLTLSNVSAATTLMEAGSNSVWNYYDGSAEPGPKWLRPEFDDSAWKTGRAPFGYGEPDISTQINFGKNNSAKHITAYFRKHFEIRNKGEFRELLILLRTDDGAVIHLNGTEIVRENIAAGPTNGKSTAQRRIDGPEETVYHRYLIPAEALATGRNQLAVEVHQFDALSSDLFFDLMLKGYGPDEVPRPARVVPEAREVTLTFRESHYVAAGTPIPDGYADGGRRMQVDAVGSVSTDREVMVVDRTRDSELSRHLTSARSEFIRSLPVLARARFLALYVDVQCSPPEGRKSSATIASLLESEFRDREMLLGNAIGSGVCRHRALLFKILADEAGLDVALVRGNLTRDGAHTWNELRLEDGTKWIVDCMNPSGGFEFPKTTDAAAQRYLTVHNEPFYSSAASEK